MMEICLFRHGIAFDAMDPACPPDPERPLTDEGRVRTRAAALGLRRLGVQPEAIWSSPYLRATETAEIARDVLLAPGAPIHRTRALEPLREADEVFTELAAAGISSVLCAGHAPHLDEALAFGLGLEDASFTRLKKAGAACLQWSGTGGRGQLLWLMTPRALRRLGKGGGRP